ncbi:MAG TPA: hypothetical protein VF669_08295 [Tepidisphaeraceae bacterium]
MEEDRRDLDYGSPPRLNRRRKDLFRLSLIGIIFGVAYVVFLFWWTLFH